MDVLRTISLMKNHFSSDLAQLFCGAGSGYKVYLPCSSPTNSARRVFFSPKSLNHNFQGLGEFFRNSIEIYGRQKKDDSLVDPYKSNRIKVHNSEADACLSSRLDADPKSPFNETEAPLLCSSVDFHQYIQIKSLMQ